NLFSRVSFHYLQPIISRGFSQPLTTKDIADLMPTHIRTEHSHVRLNEQWTIQVNKHKAMGTKPNLFFTIMRTYRWQFVPVMIYRILASTMTYVLPQLLDEILSFMGSYDTPNPRPLTLGIILAIGMFFTSILDSFFMAQYFM